MQAGMRGVYRIVSRYKSQRAARPRLWLEKRGVTSPPDEVREGRFGARRVERSAASLLELLTLGSGFWWRQSHLQRTHGSTDSSR